MSQFGGYSDSNADDFYMYSYQPYSSHSSEQTVDTTETDSPNQLMFLDAQTESLPRQPNLKKLTELVEQHKKDWNECYQQIYQEYRIAVQQMYDFGKDWPKLSRRYEISLRMSELFKEFIFTAREIVKILVQERNLPASYQTIPPLVTEGLAGGEKYLANKIFFKFAEDVVIDPNGETLYGSIENALKTTNLELNGMIALMDVLLDSPVHFPLMCIIDYGGFRVTASAQLPLDSSTIVYGSNNRGRTVHNSDAQIYAMMKQAAQKLNIKGHAVSSPNTIIYGPGDLEIHRGKDGRIYIIDTARLFCPEAPKEHNRAAVYYRNFRPEFVIYHSVPLSSDCFTGWGRYDKNIHNGEATAATELLYKQRIPSFIQLARKMSRDDDLIETLHRHGLNVRHLGYIYRGLVAANDSKLNWLREKILIETICRVLKNMLRNDLREVSDPTEENLEITAKRFFISLLHSSGKMWNEVKAKLIEYFGNLNIETSLDSFLVHKLFRIQFCEKLFQLTNVTLKIGDNLKIELIEAKNACSRVKTIPLITCEEGVSMHHLAENSTSMSQAYNYFRGAQEKYRQVLKQKPYAASVLYNLAKCAKGVAQLGERPDSMWPPSLQIAQNRLLFLQFAARKYGTALELCLNSDREKKSIILINWANVLYDMVASIEKDPSRSSEVSELYRDILSKYQQASILTPNDPNMIFSWISVLQHRYETTTDMTEKKILHYKIQALTPQQQPDIFDIFFGTSPTPAPPPTDYGLMNYMAPAMPDMRKAAPMRQHQNRAYPYPPPRDYGLVQQVAPRPYEYPLMQSAPIRAPTTNMQQQQHMANNVDMEQQIGSNRYLQDYRLQDPYGGYPYEQQ